MFVLDKTIMLLTKEERPFFAIINNEKSSDEAFSTLLKDLKSAINYFTKTSLHRPNIKNDWLEVLRIVNKKTGHDYSFIFKTFNIYSHIYYHDYQREVCEIYSTSCESNIRMQSLLNINEEVKRLYTDLYKSNVVTQPTLTSIIDSSLYPIKEDICFLQE